MTMTLETYVRQNEALRARLDAPWTMTVPVEQLIWDTDPRETT